MYVSADEVVSTDSSVEYYQQLVARYGQARVDSMIRFYLIYGNGHGDTGPFVPQFDSLKILTNWVENGVAPQAILASRTVSGVTQTRPLCPYPTFARYAGTGSTNDASNFVCE